MHTTVKPGIYTNGKEILHIIRVVKNVAVYRFSTQKYSSQVDVEAMLKYLNTQSYKQRKCIML